MRHLSSSHSDFNSNSLATVVCGPEELVRGTESEVLAQLLPLVKRGPIALDLSAAERIDAAGIAALITLYCTAVESGWKFSILKPSSQVRTLLRVVGLEPILVDGAGAGEALRTCCELTAA